MASPEVVLGIGDDGAVLAASALGQVLSVDAQVEGVHFRRDLLEPAAIGYRAIVSALSDLAAMGARPRAALLSLILPPALSDAELDGIVDGVAEAQHEYGCVVAGGNLARGSELSLTTTVIGDAPERPLTRAGARAGDAVFVTGQLGGAALGLQALLLGKAELAPGAVARWRRPVARIREGEALRGIAQAAIDVSDGLLQDLAHVCEASGVGCEIELPKLPLWPELERAAAKLALDPLGLALHGGEDYELLFTVRGGVVPELGTRIGTICPGSGIRLRDADGSEVKLPARVGYDHFERT